MPKIKVVGQTVQKLERKQTHKQTDGRTDATKRIISLASRSIITEMCRKHEMYGLPVF